MSKNTVTAVVVLCLSALCLIVGGGILAIALARRAATSTPAGLLSAAAGSDMAPAPLPDEMRREHRSPVGVEELVRRYMVRNADPQEHLVIVSFGPDMRQGEEREWVRPYEKYMLPYQRDAFRSMDLASGITPFEYGINMKDAILVRAVSTVQYPRQTEPRRVVALYTVVGQNILNRREYDPAELPSDWVARKKRETLDGLRKSYPAIP